ncbi:MAG TPA: hydroxymethylbilane synthase [Tepidisphaeraceae bacterium]|jgi:hydroxymethylbilane synthase|nr:hydroxymethylbilane synthase [Tepidisphaeraceae bacterium]
MATQSLCIGTRGSALARAQTAHLVAQLATAHPGRGIETVVIRTSGDRITDRPLYQLGGKGLFVKELEQALLDGAIDVAVHSYKDVPVTMPLVPMENLVIAAVPPREDARDALVSPSARTIGELPAGARVGTGSLRRRCQLLFRRGDVIVEAMRGNIDTRVRKLREGTSDGIILAMAGLKRAGLFDPAIMTPIQFAEMLPAPGQGALGIMCRANDPQTRQMLAPLHDPATALCVDAERAVVAELQGDCTSPIAALAELIDGKLRLQIAVGAPGGEPPVIAITAEDLPPQPAEAAAKAVLKLTAAGGVNLLKG